MATFTSFANRLPDPNFGIAEDGIVIRPVSQVSSPDPEMSTSSISVQTGGYGLADRKYNSFTVHKS